MKLDKGEEFGGVYGFYQVAGIEDRALDLENSAGLVLRVMVVDHTLDFGGLDDWIERFHLVCDLDHLSRYWFPRNLRCWGKKIGVKALKVVTESLGADES